MDIELHRPRYYCNIDIDMDWYISAIRRSYGIGIGLDSICESKNHMPLNMGSWGSFWVIRVRHRPARYRKCDLAQAERRVTASLEAATLPSWGILPSPRVKLVLQMTPAFQSLRQMVQVDMIAHVMHMSSGTVNCWLHRQIVPGNYQLDGRDAATAGFSKVTTLQQAFLARSLTNPYKQRFGASDQNGCYKCRIIRTHYHQQVGLPLFPLKPHALEAKVPTEFYRSMMIDACRPPTCAPGIPESNALSVDTVTTRPPFTAASPRLLPRRPKLNKSKQEPRNTMKCDQGQIYNVLKIYVHPYHPLCI